MSNQIATTNDSTVGVYDPSKDSDFTPRQRDDLRALQPGLEKASDADLRKLFTVSQTAGLNPYLNEIYLVGRWSQGSMVWQTQTGIDGFRKATHRYAEKRGETVSIGAPIYYDREGKEWPFWAKEIHNGQNPVACSVTVSVGNSVATSVCSWSEYAQTKKDGSLTQMWEKLGPTLLAKCCEAASHRKVCPLSSSLYTAEEMGQADNPLPTAVTATVQRQEEPKGDNRPSIEDAVVEDDGWTVDEVVSIIRSATNVNELNQQKEFIGQFVSEHPDARDQINAEWAEKSKEFA